MNSVKVYQVSKNDYRFKLSGKSESYDVDEIPDDAPLYAEYTLPHEMNVGQFKRWYRAFSRANEIGESSEIHPIFDLQ